MKSWTHEAILVQGSFKRRQFAESIYSYETVLPENLLQRGIGPLGDSTRLLKLFNKLLTGMLYTLIAKVVSCTSWVQQILTSCGLLSKLLATAGQISPTVVRIPSDSATSPYLVLRTLSNACGMTHQLITTVSSSHS